MIIVNSARNDECMHVQWSMGDDYQDYCFLWNNSKAKAGMMK